MRAWARGVYGTELAEDAGVVHVTAVWRAPDQSYVTLKIGPDTPRSAHDRDALYLSRARADGIVVTGKVLRDEPCLRYDLGPERELYHWREEVLGKREPPWLLVLTRRADFSLQHPALNGFARPVILTLPDTAQRLKAERGQAAALPVVGVPEPSVRAAVDHLRDVCGCGTISIEAGPSTSLALYEPPLAVDELMLSVFEGAEVPENVKGAPFLAPAQVQRLFVPASAPYTAAEPSGPWTFSRWLARPSS